MRNNPKQDDPLDKFKALCWDKYYANYAQGGEADVAEIYGYAPNTVTSSVHTEDTLTREAWEENTTYTEVPNLAKGKHTLSVVRTNDKMEFLIDGKVINTFEKKSEDPDKNPFIEGPYHVVSDYAVRKSEGWMTGDNADLAGIDEKAFLKGVSYRISRLSYEAAS